jgi:hypothetical protein
MEGLGFDSDENITTADIQELYDSDEFIEKYGGKSVFRSLFVPKSRALILDALISARGDALSAQIIANHHDDLSVSGVNRHREALLDQGVVVEAGKVGNAMTYQLNEHHPVVQLLAMLDNIVMWGETPMLLNEEFIAEENNGR